MQDWALCGNELAVLRRRRIRMDGDVTLILSAVRCTYCRFRSGQHLETRPRSKWPFGRPVGSAALAMGPIPEAGA